MIGPEECAAATGSGCLCVLFVGDHDRHLCNCGHAWERLTP